MVERPESWRTDRGSGGAEDDPMGRHNFEKKQLQVQQARENVLLWALFLAGKKRLDY